MKGPAAIVLPGLSFLVVEDTAPVDIAFVWITQSFSPGQVSKAAGICFLNF
jgi:hypothetical protein